MKVAIVGGTGKMGRWFASFLLREGKEVLLTGRDDQKLREVKHQLDAGSPTAPGVTISARLEAVKDADAVIISVPIDSFEAVVKQLQPHIRPGQTVLDITSVKASPVAIMHRYLKTESVLGTHPVFGPGASDMVNKNIVLTPTNEKESALAEKVKEYLEAKGARVTLMSPHEHDEMMSVVLGLSHFISLVSADTLLSMEKLKLMESIGGSTYQLLLTLAKSVITEDPEFYASLQMNLPGMAEIEAVFQRNSADWAAVVKNKDRSEFIRRMKALREKLERSDPGFKKAYGNMYKLLESESSE
ncbi:MAG: prephenate dehydrogenase [Chloroflexi bacterium]|nr:prephenate dehydrogenase [Chloroflexota bacterium]